MDSMMYSNEYLNSTYYYQNAYEQTGDIWNTNFLDFSLDNWINDAPVILDQATNEISLTVPTPTEESPSSPCLQNVPLMPGTPPSQYDTNYGASDSDYSLYEGNGDDEAIKSENVNSFDRVTEIKQEIKEELVQTNSVILNAYYNPTEYLAPQVESKPLRATKPKSTKVNNTQKPKKKNNAPKASVGSRITMEQGFMLEVPASEDGKRYIHRGDAERIGLLVKGRQSKISAAGRPSEGKGGSERSAYAKLHDALTKAKWKRTIVGDFFQYYKAE